MASDQPKAKTWKILFAGSPAYAVPSLEAIHALPECSLVGVCAQPAKPHGRGHVLQPTAVETWAKAHNIFCLTPTTLRTPEAQAAIRALAPDVAVVVAYGKLIPADLLEMLPYGWVNAHGSLLPRWRGASPIQQAILAGDTETGVTLLKLDAGMDTGPVFASLHVPIADDDTAPTLAEKLARLSAQAFQEHLVPYLLGERPLQPQPVDGVTVAPILEKSDGQLHWDEPASALCRKIRALQPWPGCTTIWNGQQLTIWKAEEIVGSAQPGLVQANGVSCTIGTAKNLLNVLEVQLAGKKRVPVDAFLRGAPGFIGTTLP
ncbi:MAG: methionyl-tRNA formyltransferase [Patescibacteria group bacterium]|jgi:methionyl-tRNA formyltransferase